MPKKQQGLRQPITEPTHDVRLLAEAMDNLGEGVLITTDELDWPGPKIVYVNRAMCRISGYTADELIGQTPRILQGKQTDKDATKRLRQDLSDKRSHLCELVNYRKDGTPYDAEVFINALYDADGNHRNYIAIHRDITQRKRDEQALRAGEAQTQAMLTSLPSHIAVIDRTGVIVAANPAWQEFSRKNQGVPVMCSLGAHYLDVCRTATGNFSDEAPAVAAGLQAILDGESSSFSIEYPCHSPTQQRWFLLQATPLQSETGGAVVAHTNITARKEAERHLRASEERLRAILDTAADAIITIDEHGVIDSVNPATELMFGYQRGELPGQNVNVLMPSPYHEEHDGYLARYLETGKARIIGIGREVVGRRKDGSTFPIDLAVSQVNHLGLFTGIIRDITERKAAVEASLREHELTETIINTAQSIVLLLDTDGRIVRFNPYLEQTTGWNLGEVRGRDWFEMFLRKDDRPPIRDLFARAIAGEQTRGNVNVIVTKDGREREIEWYDSALRDSDGHLIGLLCAGQDVTENRELARHVLNATTEQQRRIGQDLHDSIGQELAGLSMMADSLARALRQPSSADSPSATAARQKVADNLAAGMQRALKQLKLLARGMHPVEIDPPGLTSSLHELARQVSELYSVSCEFQNPDHVVVTNKDTATHLYRITQEAVSNAIMHGRAGRIVVSLGHTGESLSLRIRDDGRGLPDDANQRGGMGLRSMQYRAGLIGGRLLIAPAQGGGTLLACVFRSD